MDTFALIDHFCFDSSMFGIRYQKWTTQCYFTNWNTLPMVILQCVWAYNIDTRHNHSRNFTSCGSSYCWSLSRRYKSRSRPILLYYVHAYIPVHLFDIYDICVYKCVCKYIYLVTDLFIHCVRLCANDWAFMHIPVALHTCLHAMYVCMYVGMHVCMYACMYACVNVCMYVCICERVKICRWLMHTHSYVLHTYIHTYAHICTSIGRYVDR